MNAQDFTITETKREGSKMIFYYNIDGGNKSNQYSVKLLSSKDGYTNALINVTGDIGQEVKPGGTKKIIVDIQQEFGEDFDESINFQIVGTVYKPFIKLSTSYKTMRRGKAYLFSWTGGLDDEIINIELIKENKIISKVASINNTQRYQLKLPMGSKLGSKYKLRLFSSTDESRILYTEEFSIKRKIPLVAKVLPAFVIGAVYVVISQPKKINKLPDPIKP